MPASAARVKQVVEELRAIARGEDWLHELDVELGLDDSPAGRYMRDEPVTLRLHEPRLRGGASYEGAVPRREREEGL